MEIHHNSHVQQLKAHSLLMTLQSLRVENKFSNNTASEQRHWGQIEYCSNLPPSVRIRVHRLAFTPPAKLASSSFLIPVNFFFFAPPFFSKACFCLNLANSRILSTTFDFSTFFTNSPERIHLEPKAVKFEYDRKIKVLLCEVPFN